MDSTIIVAIISGLFTLIGSFSGVLASTRLTTYRIGELEKKVEKHNTVIERTYALEKRAEVIEEKIKVANHRIDDWEVHEHEHEN